MRWSGRSGGTASRSGSEVLPPWLAFEKRILVKTDVAERLARTLDPSKLGNDPLVIGTATDPYQPAERIYRLTRKVLEVLAGFRGLRIGIISKSPLVTRDIDVLQRLSARNEVTINVSIATLDTRLARRLELRSPVPSARIRGLARLSAAGIHAGLLLAPIVPGVTDDREGLYRLMAAAKEAGARYVIGSALRLGPAARHRFLPHLAREFPDLAERYRNHYGEPGGGEPRVPGGAHSPSGSAAAGARLPGGTRSATAGRSWGSDGRRRLGERSSRRCCKLERSGAVSP